MARILALLVLLTSQAFAGKIPEQQWAAVKAADVHARLCAEGVDQTIEDEGTRIATVGETWASLDGMPERTGATGLLYWRGLLAECLGRTDRAIEDLSRFLELHEADATWVDPTRDAMRRLERMGVVLVAGPSKPPVGRIVGVLAGGGLAAGAGVMGALAGVRSEHMRQLEESYYSGSLDTAQFNEVAALGEEAARDVNGFAAASAGLTIGGVTSILISALAPEASNRSLHRASLVPIVTPTSVHVALGFQW